MVAAAWSPVNLAVALNVEMGMQILRKVGLVALAHDDGAVLPTRRATRRWPSRFPALAARRSTSIASMKGPVTAKLCEGTTALQNALFVKSPLRLPELHASPDTPGAG